MSDLLDAREQYHVHLMRHPKVVATAIGYYRIRKGDTPPGVHPPVHGTGPRNLMNSEVRSYSWPAVLVFVEDWIAATDFGSGRPYDADEIVPKTLYLPDGRRVPVCVIEAPKDPKTPDAPDVKRHPLNNIGSGHPVFVEVQNRNHFATIACLVTDGHRTYALTNRHVTGEPGLELSSQLGGRSQPIGLSSPHQATRVPFTDLYPGWPGKAVYVNMDAGLIDVTDVNSWTAKLQDNSVMGPMVDLSVANFPMSLLGRYVRGYGAASNRWVFGEVQALFYRYKSKGGFEYVADFFIGPRTPTPDRPEQPSFATMPGDSGTLWLLEPSGDKSRIDGNDAAGTMRPLALQWGANRLYSSLSSQPHSYALATCLSTICDRLDVDVVRDWNLDQPDTWGAVGHFAIASRVAKALSEDVPTLKELMDNNAEIISHDDQTILSDEFKKMGDLDFIPMADVPDFFWKHGHQGHNRPFEGPNHFADMDQVRESDGIDLLELCKDPKNIDPKVWNDFYSSVEDLLDGGPITMPHRGLLPFRVWQIFEAMVQFVRDDDMPSFVCAAGVLTHYVGDSCQPLHISYLHDGNPMNSTSHTVHHHDGTTSITHIPEGRGLHGAYEDDMVNAHRKQILDGLDETPAVQKSELIASGRDAAQATIELMRATFEALPPPDMLRDYLAAIKKNQDTTEMFWKNYGLATIKAMQDGTHLLAVLWESAWVTGGGEDAKRSTARLKPEQAMGICAPAEFLPSCSITTVGKFLGNAAAKSKPKGKPKTKKK
ncbi:hypothetical protein [Bradyrhizobium iriomotense]|uniref:S1/P1 Nuclease n=1 Tax=Bradyrhizobium iriomotense TaxID=441950 RepID=A0ABQ6AZ39_9BRAD|nr:hypothetical protein [Bradyrhizobium iriomotense]GLR86476.1 hypothetical protein GCM10007857_31870 [Bradyrhizobium iriomotense]